LTVSVGDLFETITPPAPAANPYRVSPADLDSVTAALGTLSTVVDRVRARQPRPVPVRAPRRPRR
jgi:hypothetical protein